MDNNEKVQELYQQWQDAEERKDWQTAIKAAEELAEKHEHYGAQINLPRLYSEVNNYEKVLEYVRAYVNDLLANYNEAEYRLKMQSIANWEIVALKKLGRVDEAIEVAKKCVNVHKETLDVIMSHTPGRTYSDMDNSFKSEHVAPLVIALNLLGEMYFEKGKYSEAGDALIESRDCFPTFDSMYYLSQMLLNGLGDAPKNIKVAEEYLLWVSKGLSRQFDDNSIDGDDLQKLEKTTVSLAKLYSTEEGFIDRNKAIEYYKKAKEYGYEITDEEIAQKVENDIKQATSFTSFVKKETKKGCYVATCVYGSYDCPQVWTLRRFRDEMLAKSILGRLFIFIYYIVSPTVVKLFGKQQWFNKLFRAPLDKLVNTLREKGVENTPYNDK